MSTRDTRCEERKEWTDIAIRLHDMQRQTAPTTLFDDVMARIALERAEQNEGQLVAGYRGYSGIFSRKFVQDVMPLLVLLGSWLLTISTLPHASDRLSYIGDTALSTVRYVGSEIVRDIGVVLSPASLGTE